MSLEKAFGRLEFESEERREINELISITREEKRTIALHIEDIDQNAVSNFTLLNDGLKSLAHMLRNDATFSDVENIVGYTSIATLYPRVVQELGFETVEEDSPLRRSLDRKYNAAEEIDPVPEKYQAVSPSLIRMSKDDFLRRYGA